MLIGDEVGKCLFIFFIFKQYLWKDWYKDHAEQNSVQILFQANDLNITWRSFAPTTYFQSRSTLPNHFRWLVAKTELYKGGNNRWSQTSVKINYYSLVLLGPAVRQERLATSFTMSCSNIVCFLTFQNSQGITITYLIAREVVHRKSIVEVVQRLLILSDHRHNNDHILGYFWHQLVKWAILEHVWWQDIKEKFKADQSLLGPSLSRHASPFSSYSAWQEGLFSKFHPAFPFEKRGACGIWFASWW